MLLPLLGRGRVWKKALPSCLPFKSEVGLECANKSEMEKNWQDGISHKWFPGLSGACLYINFYLYFALSNALCSGRRILNAAQFNTRYNSADWILILCVELQRKESRNRRKYKGTDRRISKIIHSSFFFKKNSNTTTLLWAQKMSRSQALAFWNGVRRSQLVVLMDMIYSPVGGGQWPQSIPTDLYPVSFQ